MIRRFSALLCAIALLSCLAAATPASAKTHALVQTLFFDAVYRHASSAGPAAPQVGHEQIAGGILRDAHGRRIGTFTFTCTWVKAQIGGASESCAASARTSDGRFNVAGPSQSSSFMHTWKLTGGTRSYHGASGVVRIRDLGDRESLLTITAAAPERLHAGRVDRPPANASFIAHADVLCRRAGAKLATLPPFPLPDFDPLHPDPSELPVVGAFFSGPGNPRPILRALDTRLHRLGLPPAQVELWGQVLRARQQELRVIDRQDRAALTSDAAAFVRSVHESSADYRTLAIAATVFGATRCVL